MTREEARELLYGIQTDAVYNILPSEKEAIEMAINALEQEPILDKIRAEIGMYEANCRLQGGTDECEKCNSNVFGSIYRIIDKYKAESEEENADSN